MANNSPVLVGYFWNDGDIMAESEKEKLEIISELELELARRKAYEAGKRYGRSRAILEQVYETRWDCFSKPGRARRKVA